MQIKLKTRGEDAQITLETGGEDVKTTLETSGELAPVLGTQNVTGRGLSIDFLKFS